MDVDKAYIYEQLPKQHQLSIVCKNIKYEYTRNGWFGKKIWTHTPEFRISDETLWRRLNGHKFRGIEAEGSLAETNRAKKIAKLRPWLDKFDGSTQKIKNTLALMKESEINNDTGAEIPFNGTDQDAKSPYWQNALHKGIAALYRENDIIDCGVQLVPRSFDPNLDGTVVYRLSIDEANLVNKNEEIAEAFIDLYIHDFCLANYNDAIELEAMVRSLQGIRTPEQYTTFHDPYTTEQITRINELFNYCTRGGNSTPRAKDLQHIFNSAIENRDWTTADTIYLPLANIDSSDVKTSFINRQEAIAAIIYRETDPDGLFLTPLEIQSWEMLGKAREDGLQKYPRDIPTVTYNAVTQATIEDLVTYVNGYSMPNSEKLLTSQQQQIGNEAASRESNRQALDNARTTMQQEDTAKQMEASKNYVTDTNAHVDDTIKLMATKSALSPSVPETVMVPGDEAMMYAAETMEQIENTNGNEPEMSEVDHETMPSFPRNCGSGNVNSRQGMDTYANDLNAENDFTGAAEEAYIVAAYNVEFGSMEYWEAYEDYHRPPAEEEKKKEPTAMQKLGILASIGKDAAVKAAKNVGNAAMKAGTSLANTAGQLGSELLGATGDTLANVKDSIMNVSAESLFDKAMGVTKSLVCDSDGNFSLGKAISSASNIRNIMQTKDPLNQMTKLSAFAGNTLGMPRRSKAVDMATKAKRNGFSIESAMEIGGSITEKLGLTGEGKDTLFNRFSKDSLMDASLFRGAMDAVKSGNPQRLGDFLSSSKVENAFKNTDMPNMLFNNLTPSTSNCNGLAKLGSTFGFSPSTTKDLSGKLGDSAQPPPMSDAEHQATVAAIKSAAIDTRSYHSPGADKKMTAIGMDVDEAKMRSTLASEFTVC